MRSGLGYFELMVLLAVMRLEHSAYGVPIAREIEETRGRAVALASVYAVLDRLEERELVTSALGESTPERGGRAKRHFQVTRKGIREAQEAKQALTRAWSRVPQLKGRMA